MQFLLTWQHQLVNLCHVCHTATSQESWKMAVLAAVAHLTSHEVKPLNKDSGNEKLVTQLRHP